MSLYSGMPYRTKRKENHTKAIFYLVAINNNGKRVRTRSRTVENKTKRTRKGKRTEGGRTRDSNIGLQGIKSRRQECISKKKRQKKKRKGIEETCKICVIES